MFLTTRPTARWLDAYLDAQRGGRHSYGEVGATRARTPPSDYTIDHNRVLLGGGRPASGVLADEGQSGAEVFGRATDALRGWAMFTLGWCTIHPPDAPIAQGVVVAAVIRHLGFWSVNPSRIVYVLDERRGDVRRFGFAYGTLADHAEVGEERFSVEWSRVDDRVWYDLYAFSRPGHPLARLGYTIGRILQHRFARDSKRAMVSAVRNGAFTAR